jgi:hypothetical protein
MILLVEVFVVRLLRKRKEVSTNTNIDSNTSAYNAIEQRDSVSA